MNTGIIPGAAYSFFSWRDIITFSLEMKFIITRKLLLALIIMTLPFSGLYCADEVDDLLGCCVKCFKPETAELVIAGKTDSAENFSGLYMELRSVMALCI